MLEASEWSRRSAGGRGIGWGGGGSGVVVSAERADLGGDFEQEGGKGFEGGIDLVELVGEVACWAVKRSWSSVSWSASSVCSAFVAVDVNVQDAVGGVGEIGEVVIEILGKAGAGCVLEKLCTQAGLEARTPASEGWVSVAAVLTVKVPSLFMSTPMEARLTRPLLPVMA